jgi:hypothetical protein
MTRRSVRAAAEAGTMGAAPAATGGKEAPGHASD